MKFYVKNNFYLIVNKKRIRKIKGEIIDVAPNRINELQKRNIIGAPVKEIVIETAVIKPVENEMINRDIEKKVLDISHFPIPKLRPKNIKKKGKK